MEASILFDAINSMFEKFYKPINGIFHVDKKRFEHDGHILRNELPANMVHMNNKQSKELGIHQSTNKSHKEATVDNLTIGGEWYIIQGTVCYDKLKFVKYFNAYSHV